MLVTPFIEPQFELDQAEQDWEQDASFSYQEESEDPLTANEITETDAGRLTVENVVELLLTGKSNGVVYSTDKTVARKEAERLARSFFSRMMLRINDQAQRAPILQYAQSFTGASADWLAYVSFLINNAFDFKKRIVANTITEYNTWLGTKTNNTWAIKEYDAGALVHLRKYWNAIPSPPAVVDPHTYWSAAFISYILKQSGALDFFAYSSAHITYIRQAKRNRDTTAQHPFRLYTIAEFIARMQPGDMLCKVRQGSGLTFANVLTHPNTAAHVDIITEIDRANNFIRVVGGNVSDNVDHKGLTIVGGNRIVNSDNDPYFAGIGIGIA